MPEPGPGWTEGAGDAGTPLAGPADDAPPLTPDLGHPADSPAPAHRRASRETRLGAAALLSFLVIVGVLGFNKWRRHGASKPKDAAAVAPVLSASDGGKLPPVAQIGAGATPPAPSPVEPEPEPKRETEPGPSPAGPAEGLAHEAPAPPGTDPAEDGHAPEPVTLTVARNEPGMNPGLAPGPGPGPEPASGPEPVPLPALPGDGPQPAGADDHGAPPAPAPLPAGKPEANEPPATGDKPAAPVPVPTPPASAAAPIPAPAPPAGQAPEPAPLPGGPATPAPAPVPVPPVDPPAPVVPAASAPAPLSTPEARPATPPPTAAINPPTGPLPGSAIIPSLGAAATVGAAAAHGADAPKPGAETPGSGLPELSKPEPTPAPPPPAVTAPGIPEPSPALAPPAGPEPTPSLAPPAPAPTPAPAAAPNLMPQPAAPAPTPTPAPGAGPLERHPVDIPNLDPAPPAEPAAPDPASMPAPAHAAGEPGAVKARPDQAAELGAGKWVLLPLGNRARKEDDAGHRALEPAAPRPEPEPEAAVATSPAPAPEGSRPMRTDREATPAPAPASGADDRDRDRVETVPHVVQRGENFWTISQLYYGSGRFYKALAAANDRAGTAITQIYVGQTIRIPPPEALDRHLIEPPRARTAAATASVPTRPATARGPGEIEVALPTSNPFGRTRSAATGPDLDEPARGASVRPRRPQYRVRANETLRSIARDTLGDSRRADEILELNADAIEDPHDLVPGQILELPADARVAAGPSGRDR